MDVPSIQIRRWLCAVAMLVVCGQATADTTYEMGPLSPGGYPFVKLVGSDEFTDTYNFELEGTNNFEISVINFQMGTAYNINDLAFALYGTEGAELGAELTYSGLLDPGVYHFTVSGTGSGTYGGYYTGLINVTAVPEAEVWVMMAAGLGLLGLKMGRRQRSQLVT